MEEGEIFGVIIYGLVFVIKFRFSVRFHWNRFGSVCSFDPIGNCASRQSPIISNADNSIGFIFFTSFRIKTIQILLGTSKLVAK